MAGKFRLSLLRLPSDAVELAYLAGLFDGEGSVFRHKTTKAWRVVITSTHLPLAIWLGGLGGTVRPKTRYSSRHSPAYDWYLERGSDALMFLEAVRPYLRIKDARADAAMADLRARIPQLRLEGIV